MSIVIYDDVILDECVFIAGATGEVNRQNDRVVNQGGYASVNAIRDISLRKYTFGVKPMYREEWLQVRGAWEITDAGAFGFLIKDPIDQGTTFDATDGLLMGYMSGVEFGALGFGNGAPSYGFRQIFKAKSSTRSKAVAVTRLNGTPVVKRGNTTVNVGVGAGNISIGAGPSYVTFVADDSKSVSAVTVGATTQVTLASAITGFVVGGRLWLQDLTGADAALLNNLSHQITNIAGAVYTLATNTAGKTITAAGTGKKYPQPDEALTWQGDYYIPVQFAEDALDWDIVKPGALESRLVSGPTVTLIEVREA